MSECPHTPKYPDLAQVPTLQEAMSQCIVVEDVPEVKKQRALTAADGVTTRIDSGYWSGLNDAQKAALIAHERAHPCIGMEVACEGCADKVGGYYMRAWGYSPAIVRQSYASLRVRRDLGHGNIADNGYEGAKVAERGLAGRGLLGMSGDATSARLLADRALAPPPASVLSRLKTAVPTSSPLVAAAAAVAGAPLTTTTTDAKTEPTGAGGVPGAFPLPPPSPSVADGSDIAGDVVSAVLGETARPHAVPVLIAAAVAATLAVVLVVLVRHRSK